MGGAEHSLLDIINQASEAHETFLVTSETGLLTEKVSSSGCTSIVVPCTADMSVFKRKSLFFNIITNLRMLNIFFHHCREVKRHVDSLHPDCIHSNVPKSHIILFYILLCGFDKRSIFHIREIFEPYSFSKCIYMILFNKRRSSVIAISEAVKRSLPARLKKHTAVLYNGVDIPSEHNIKRKTSVPPRFLYLGRVVPWKGCELLIDAFQLLYNKYKSGAGMLSITGGTLYWNNKYRDDLTQKIKESGLDSCIYLTDHTTDISHVFLSHTVFCLPSYQEPFGRVAAEAMAYGLPVLGFRSGGLPEIVEHTTTGLLAETRTAHSLFEIMEQCVLFPDHMSQMGINGRKRCAAFFNKDIQIQRILAFMVAVSESTP
jgi:glycosyltransferase involved in cell wall biosynthesis